MSIELIYVKICPGDSMLKTKDILDEKDKRLKNISKEVSFPLADEDKKLIESMIEYLTNSQIPELAEKYNLRPGMGMSAIQLGIPKRYFVVVHEYEEQKFKNYIIINPKMTSNSEEKIYVEEGEGCLSINRETVGIVPRFARASFEGYDLDGNKINLRVREEVAIAFQHELDHLDGILFVDRIDKKEPYKYADRYRAI